jgi:hypothetical protein
MLYSVLFFVTVVMIGDYCDGDDITTVILLSIILLQTLLKSFSITRA